jgi:hypothetical protein
MNDRKAGDLSPEIIKEVQESGIDSTHDHLNSEVMTYEERMKLLYPEFWQAVENGRKGAIDMSHLTPEEFVEAITNIKR